MTYRIPRHIGCSPHRSKYLGEEPIYVRLSGAEKGSLLLLLLYAWAALTCSGHLIPSEVFSLRLLRNKRKKRRK
jgi:hypothetical protein